MYSVPSNWGTPSLDGVPFLGLGGGGGYRLFFLLPLPKWHFQKPNTMKLLEVLVLWTAVPQKGLIRTLPVENFSFSL